MSIKYKTFSIGDAVYDGTSCFGMINNYRRLYYSDKEVYQAAAAFATSVGDRLVTITGLPASSAGELVVWYKEEDRQ